MQNPRHLLIFAAGNSGVGDGTVCTVAIPAAAKNVLAVGASSSGETRWTVTGTDGNIRSSWSAEGANMDTVAQFSSRGLTTDGRIKPEVVAPGDQVLYSISVY